MIKCSDASKGTIKQRRAHPPKGKSRPLTQQSHIFELAHVIGPASTHPCPRKSGTSAMTSPTSDHNPNRPAIIISTHHPEATHANHSRLTRQLLPPDVAHFSVLRDSNTQCTPSHTVAERSHTRAAAPDPPQGQGQPGKALSKHCRGPEAPAQRTFLDNFSRRTYPLLSQSPK